MTMTLALERGTHDELLAFGGFYAELNGLQSGEPVLQLSASVVSESRRGGCGG
jgi:hypothetical protein